MILTLLATTAPGQHVVPITAYIHTNVIYFVPRYPILSDTCGADYVVQSAAAHATICRAALCSTYSRPIHWYKNMWIWTYMRWLCVGPVI